MKLVKSIILCVILGSSTLYTSCNLDLAPIDYYASSSYWKTTAQVTGYMNGIHNDLRSTSLMRQFLMGEARGGSSKAGTSSLNTSINYDRIKINGISADNAEISGWGGLYGNIFDCNLLIQKLEGTDLHLNNKATMDYTLAQAYGIRAYYYFYLYRTYGGLPLIDKVKVLNGSVSAEALYTERSTPKQTMEFIKADLQKSLDYFGTIETINGTKSFWSKAATTMLAGDVYLWSSKVTLSDQSPAAGDLAKAEAYFTTIKNDSRFGLMATFSSIFDVTNKGNKETIFAIRYAEGEATNSASEFAYANPNGNFIGSVYGRNGKLITTDTLNLKGSGWQRNEYQPSLWQSFAADDSRRDATFLEFYKKDGTLQGTVMRKNLGTVNTANVRLFVGDEPEFRYADVLLKLAEIENMKGGDVAQYLNTIRQRAYGSKWNINTYGYTNSDFKTNELAILKERDKEFVFEGKRWFDICRMKTALNGNPLVFSPEASYTTNAILSYPADAYKLLWPIDKTTLNADPKLKQTKGYAVAGQTEVEW